MDEAQALLRLQEIDLETIRITNDAKKLPQHAKIAAAQAALKKVQGELVKIVGQRKDLQMDIEGFDRLRGDAERLEQQASQDLQTSADARAVADLESRLNAVTKRIEKIDYQQNQALEQLITVERAEKNANALQARLQNELAQLLGSLKQELLDSQNCLTALKREREEVAALVSPEMQARYNRANERFKGRAVETLTGNKPSSCRVALQPAQYADLKRRKLPVDECPYCHRILITDWH